MKFINLSALFAQALDAVIRNDDKPKAESSSLELCRGTKKEDEVKTRIAVTNELY